MNRHVVCSVKQWGAFAVSQLSIQLIEFSRVRVRISTTVMITVGLKMAILEDGYE